MTRTSRSAAAATAAHYLLPLLAPLLTLCAPLAAQAQGLNPCNYLFSYPSGSYLTLIPTGTTIIDGGYADRFTSDWCSLGHLEVQTSAWLYNGRVPGGSPSGTTQFRNGFVTVLPYGIFFTDTVLTNHGTVENGAYGVFINSAPLINDGVLNNRGVMSGSQTYPNNGGSYFGSIDNRTGGTFNNSGSLTFDPGNTYYVALSNTGIINNSGTVTNAGNVVNDGMGVFNNTGALFNLSGASVSIGANSIFNNGSAGPSTGSLVSQGRLLLAGTLNNSGSLRNEGSFAILAGAVVNNLAGSNTVIDNHGTLTNSGTLTAVAGTTINNAGNFYNSHIISGQGGLTNAVDAMLENRGTMEVGSLVNDGQLYTFTAITVHGGFNNSGSLTNYVGGPIRVEGPVVNDGPRFDADGDVISLPRMDLYGSFHATGDFYNSTYGGISVLGGRLDIDGSLRNDGFMNNRSQVWLNGPAAGAESLGYYIQAGPPGALTVVNGAYWGNIRIDSGTLSGTGTIRGAVGVNGAVLAPGPYNGLTIQRAGSFGSLVTAKRLDAAAATPTGTLTIDGDLYFDSGTLLLAIAGTGPDHASALHVTGHASFAAGTLMLAFVDGFLPTLGDHWTLLLADGGTDGLATLHLAYDGLPDGYGFSAQVSDAGLAVEVTGVAASVPEPAAGLLWAVGLAGLLVVSAKRRRCGADAAVLAVGVRGRARPAARQDLTTA